MSQILSVVVPCFNEEEVIVETHKRLLAVLVGICQKYELFFEIIYVDDGSSDKTLSLLQGFSGKRQDLRGEIKILALSRNFGHQTALSSGLKMSKGNATVAIDADLQDPPEVIESMFEQWRLGADIVYGIRTKRAGETLFKLLTAKLFYVLVRKLTKIDIPLDTGDFRLLSRRALSTFNAMPERNRFIRGMVPWMGYKQVGVNYDRQVRFAGETKYPLNKMIKLALDGITSFSNTPLQIAFFGGVVTALCCFFYAFYIVVYATVFGFPVAGWSSLMVAILFLGAVQLICLGVLGEYIGRIYDEVKRRPTYIIDYLASRGFEE